MICPSCFTKYPDDGTSHCATDKTALVPDETFAHVDKELGPGTSVGEYRIESKLGEGGFGAVYRAVHPLIGKSAAVKILARQFSANPQMVSRFVAEARAVNQIRNRNIIDIFSFGQLPDGRQYYIMELLEGQSLDAYIAKKVRLTMEEAFPILRGVARALDAAHAKGILHRDLKPENIFLAFDDDDNANPANPANPANATNAANIQPKLLDFGLVKLLATESSKSDSGGSSSSSGSHKTKTGTPMGTPYYMSPEQCRGLEVDARTDVYSFGALVFEMLTGEVPFTGASAMDILVQHMTASPPRASGRTPTVPSALDEPLMRMMAKEPKDRPARVGEALEMLARAANLDVGMTSGITSKPSSPSQQDVGSTTLMTDSERAIATTLVADPQSSTPAPVKLVTPAPNVVSSRPAPQVGQTFLGGAEIPDASGKRSRAPLIVASILGVVSIAGLVAFVVVASGMGKRSTATATATAPATSISTSTATAIATTTAVSSQQPSATATVLAREDVDFRVEGVPDGTTVSANGAELGKTPASFKLKINAPAKITVSAKGYKAKEVTITPTDNVIVPVTLEKAIAVGAAGPPAGGHKAPTPSSGSTIHSDLEGFDKK